MGHLFIPCASPERPNPGFFKGLFGGGHTSLDREELCELKSLARSFCCIFVLYKNIHSKHIIWYKFRLANNMLDCKVLCHSLLFYCDTVQQNLIKEDVRRL